MDPTETIINGDLKFAELVRARWPEAEFTFRAKVARKPWWRVALTGIFGSLFAGALVALIMTFGTVVFFFLPAAGFLGFRASRASQGDTADFWVKDGGLLVQYGTGGRQPFALSEMVKRYPQFDVEYFFKQARKAHEKSLTDEQRETAHLEEIKLNQMKAALMIEEHYAFDLRARKEVVKRAEALKEVSDG